VAKCCVAILIVLLKTSLCVYSQYYDAEGIESFTLEQSIDYALENQPALNQAQINISIAKATNAINLSGWLPQVNLLGSGVHYFQIPTFFAPSTSGGTNTFRTLQANSLTPQLAVTQNIFNPQLLFAAKSAGLFKKQAVQARDSAKINLYVSVSKSFYNLLLTLSQIDVLKEDTARLARVVRDTYHQYVGGIVDETDYDQAIITLNNSKIQLVQQMENVAPAYAVLKQVMGYPPQKDFNVVFDTSSVMADIDFDTTRSLEFENRIEYQQLLTSKELQHKLVNYYRLAFLPTLSVSYAYFYAFQNSQVSDIFKNAYPYSDVGLTFNLPIFTGFSRLENIRKAKLQESNIDWSLVAVKSQIYTDYKTAMASYKSNLYNWNVLRNNVRLARRVFRIVSLQYMQGIVPYLNMIVAESNLITAEVGYSNALYQLLSSKVDLRRAIGDIYYNPKN
jgi:outer membrane protein TolC